MGNMLMVECSVCKEPLSKLGNYVFLGFKNYAHVDCFMGPLIDAARYKAVYNEREAVHEAQQAEQEAAEARQRAVAEAARVKGLAAENMRLEALRLKTLTLAAQEAMKKESQGEAKDRFALVAEELGSYAPPTAEDTAQAAARAAEDEARKALSNACVRCGQPVTAADKAKWGTERHCSTCWLDNSTGQKANLPKQDLEKLIKDGLRPIELD